MGSDMHKKQPRYCLRLVTKLCVISKIHGFKGVRYNTYTKMFNSCVVPVIDYCSGIGGTNN